MNFIKNPDFIFDVNKTVSVYSQVKYFNASIEINLYHGADAYLTDADHKWS